MRRILIPALAIVLSALLTAAPRTVIDLGGDWKFNTKDDLSFAKERTDDASWKTVRFPGFWQEQGFADSGHVWARRTVSVSGALPAELVIDGLYDEAEVFVNGKRAGKVRGSIGMMANLFPIPEARRIDVSGLFRTGENVIAIRFFDNPTRSEWIWRNFPYPSAKGLAGIEKGISLECAQGVFIRLVDIRVAEKGMVESAYRFGVTCVNRTGKTVNAAISLTAAGEQKKSVSIAAGTSRIDLAVKSRNGFGKKSYAVSLASDAGNDSADGTWHTVIIEPKNGKIYLNGEEFIVKGLNGHLLWPEPIAADLIELLMDMNVNLVRPPQGNHLWFKDYDQFQSVMVFPVVSGNFSCKEIADWTKPVPKKTYTFEESATNEIADYIASASLSPMIFGWNTANEIETGNKPEREEALVALLKTMRDYVRRDDGYERPAIYANLMMESQRITGGQDVIGYNHYIDPDSFDFAKVKAVSGNTPFVYSETDCPSLYWKLPYWNNIPFHIPYQEKTFKKMLAAGGSGTMLYSGLFDYYERHVGVLSGVWQKPDLTLANMKINEEYRDFVRYLYRDFDHAVVSGAWAKGSAAVIRIVNIMPYALKGFTLISGDNASKPVDIAPGAKTEIALTAGTKRVRAEFTTHGGLKHATSFVPSEQYTAPAQTLSGLVKTLERKTYALEKAASLNGCLSPEFKNVEDGALGQKNFNVEGKSPAAAIEPGKDITDDTEGSARVFSFTYNNAGFRNDWIRITMPSPVTDINGWDGIALRIRNDGGIRKIGLVIFDDKGNPVDIYAVPVLYEKGWTTVHFIFNNKEQLREQSTKQFDALNRAAVKTFRFQIDDYVIKEELTADDLARAHTIGAGEIAIGEVALIKLK
ncbi:MAG: carbohydrate binding domain-containing protein [Spirochaetota bacterium]